MVLLSITLGCPLFLSTRAMVMLVSYERI